MRGELGVTLDADIAYRIGRAFAQILRARFLDHQNNDDAQGDASVWQSLQPIVVVGYDIRESSSELAAATMAGIMDAGMDVLDIGMTGTEEVYFATSHMQALGGIEVTASHNPINYNGLKLVREQSKPLSSDEGLAEIQALAESGEFTASARGQKRTNTDKSAYIQKLMSFIDTKKMRPLKLVINSGNGSAAPVVDKLIEALQAAGAPLEIITMHHTPDGSFPNGIPNPMIIANRVATQEAVLAHDADMGIAFDGDFDRCFFFDENARFIDGSYVVGMLAQAFLNKYPSETIVYDPRVLYNTEAVIKAHAGQAAMSKSGHSFIKQVMRESKAVYGGEMSAHHYFRDFCYCDSGMIPWLLTAELLSTTQKPLSELVDDYISAYPSSGELNFRLTHTDAPALIDNIAAHFAEQSPEVNTLDGLSMDFGAWRFNLRASNTEPLVRLNIETRGDQSLLAEKITHLQDWLTSQGAHAA
ncbi:phosphomannomutase [Psychrobacter aestuarii]|uniref:phosphomannomutase n=1 Tax=Psychrobacter aestuarii TaxID=556327 RepID=A0ABP3FQ91_9GAMM